MNKNANTHPTKSSIEKFIRKLKKRMYHSLESKEVIETRRQYCEIQKELEKNPKFVKIRKKLNAVCEKDRKFRRELQEKLVQVEDYYNVNGITKETIKRLNVLMKLCEKTIVLH